MNDILKLLNYLYFITQIKLLLFITTLKILSFYEQKNIRYKKDAYLKKSPINKEFWISLCFKDIKIRI